MSEQGFVALNPTTTPHVVEREMAPRLEDLSGKVTGILWNSKPNGDILLARVAEVLSRRFDLQGVVQEHKVKAYILEHARSPVNRFSPGNRRRALSQEASPDTLIPIVENKDDLTVIVTGSMGKHSSWLPTFGGSTRSVTREILTRE